MSDLTIVKLFFVIYSSAEYKYGFQHNYHCVAGTSLDTEMEDKQFEPRGGLKSFEKIDLLRGDHLFKSIGAGTKPSAQNVNRHQDFVF